VLVCDGSCEEQRAMIGELRTFALYDASRGTIPSAAASNTQVLGSEDAAVSWMEGFELLLLVCLVLHPPRHLLRSLVV